VRHWCHLVDHNTVGWRTVCTYYVNGRSYRVLRSTWRNIQVPPTNCRQDRPDISWHHHVHCISNAGVAWSPFQLNHLTHTNTHQCALLLHHQMRYNHVFWLYPAPFFPTKIKNFFAQPCGKPPWSENPHPYYNVLKT